MRVLTAAMIVLSTVFLAINVEYRFESSELIVDVNGEGPYVVFLNGASYTTDGELKLPWSKGKVGVLRIVSERTGESTELVVEAVHDNPPKIDLEIPRVLGLGTWNFGINVVDDWDSATTVSVSFEIDSGDEIRGREVVLDTFFMGDGTHTISVTAEDSFGNESSVVEYFEVDTVPPDPPDFEFRSPDLVIFPGKPDVLVMNLESGRSEYLRGVDVIKRDTAMMIGGIDEAGNVSRMVFIKPVPGTLVPVSTRGPITSIMEDTLLLGNGSFYTVLGKTILPENRTLVLGSGVGLVISPTGELLVKGLFMNMSSDVKILGGGSLVLGEGARVFLDGIDMRSHVKVVGGRVIYLNDVRGFDRLEISNVDNLILENVELDSLSVEGVQNFFLYDATLSKLSVRGTRNFEARDVDVGVLELSEFSRADFRNVKADSFALDVLSRIDCISCRMGPVMISKGSRARFRESDLLSVESKDFSSVELFETRVEGKIEIIRSELVYSECEFVGEVSESGGMIRER